MRMRIGSGGVLLIGFTVLVMIITLAMYVNPTTVQVHADTSSDFVDLSDAINQLAGTVKYLPVSDHDKYAWLDGQIRVLNRTISPKGVHLNNYSRYIVSDKVLVAYSIRRGSTFFDGVAGDVNYFMKPHYGGGGTGGSTGGPTPGPLYFIPNKLCAYGPRGRFPDHWHALFLVLNPTFSDYNAEMTFIGPDAILPWWLIVPISASGNTVRGLKPFGENQTTLNFYMPSATEIRVKRWTFKVPGVAFTGLFVLWRSPAGNYGDVIQVTLSGNKVNYLPLYWYDNFFDWLHCFLDSKRFYPPRMFGQS